jgi:hypothetical protein
LKGKREDLVGIEPLDLNAKVSPPMAAEAPTAEYDATEDKNPTAENDAQGKQDPHQREEAIDVDETGARPDGRSPTPGAPIAHAEQEHPLKPTTPSPWRLFAFLAATNFPGVGRGV